MSVSDTLTNLGDTVRDLTWKNDKMTIAEMTSALSNSRTVVNVATPMPQMHDAKGFSSTPNGDGSQTFAKSQGQFAGETITPINALSIKLKKGDILVERVMVKATGFKDMTANIRGDKTKNHPVARNLIDISDKLHQFKYTFTAQEDDTYHLLEFWSSYSGPDDVTFFNPYAAVISVGG